MSREGPHVLFCAFAEVPGPSAAGVRTAQMMGAFGAGFDVDGLCLKGPEGAHIERLGSVRVMRVPVDNKPFLERLAAYRRALARQLAGDHYDVVWCAELFSGAVAASYQQAHGFSLLVDVDDVPSQSFARLYEVDPTDKQLRAEWAAGEKAALRGATVVLAPSRMAAKAFSTRLAPRVDARRIQVLPRAVDRSVFAPPTMELAFGEERTVLVLGGRDGGPLLPAALALLQAIGQRTEREHVHLAFAGARPADDAPVRAALDEAGLGERVKLVDVENAAGLAAALAEAHVVVVPSTAEVGVEPFAPPHRALSAMACRRPTILTGPPASFADMLVPGEDALVTDANDPAAAAAAVERLLDGPALRESIAQSGARRVEQEADLVTRLGQAAALLSDLLGVALAPRAEGSERTDPFEPKGGGTLPPPPVRDPTESGRHPPVSQVAVRVGARGAAREARAPKPETPKPEAPKPEAPKPEAPKPDGARAQATRRHTLGSTSSLSGASSDASSVFTDEGSPARAAPTAPSAVDVGASSIEASLVDAGHLEPLPGDKTVVAPPPEGLADALATPGDDGRADEWYGDTRIDSNARYPAEPTPLEERARAATRKQVAPEPPTSSSPLGSRAFSAQPEPMSLPEGDPWGHDTIADARPVFSSDDVPRKSSGQERTPAPSERSFLVDPELFTEGSLAPLEDATVDELKLPQEPSSDG